MFRYKISGKEKHILEHKKFFDMAAEFQAMKETEPLQSVAKKMAMFLGEWLVDHILGTDKLLAQKLLRSGHPESSTALPR